MTITMLILMAIGVGGLILLAVVLVYLVWAGARKIRSTQGAAPFNTNQTEAVVSVIAALFVLFSAMLSPLISVALAIVFLLALAAYQLLGQHPVG
jgi:heme/copper-type cytochrome/quinol oxidase subunit 2